MLEFTALSVLACWGMMTIISLVNALAATRLTQVPNNSTSRGSCSVLIPARNEEETLEALLTDLQNQDYEDFEVWIYDDQSTDSTPVIIQRFEQKDKRFNEISGTELPEGWQGKNYACHRLSREAEGDYLLFLDADVRVGSQLLTSLIAYLQDKELEMVSVFPLQIMYTFGERLTVPLMNWILVSLLPLPLVRRLGFPSISAANGQCMLFEASHYHENQWHAKHRNETAEDIVIARSLKARGNRMQTLLGTKSVRCRMYHGYREAVDGFSKNIHAYFGHSRLLLVLFISIVVGGIFSVGLALGWAGLIGLAGFWTLNRWFVSLASGQSILWNLLLSPLQLLALIHITLKSFYNFINGSLNWKGRTVSP